MHWIRKMRIEKGWSQKELAEKAGCSAGLIDMLENSDGEVTHWEIANGIASALAQAKPSGTALFPRRGGMSHLFKRRPRMEMQTQK